MKAVLWKKHTQFALSLVKFLLQRARERTIKHCWVDVGVVVGDGELWTLWRREHASAFHTTQTRNAASWGWGLLLFSNHTTTVTNRGGITLFGELHAPNNPNRFVHEGECCCTVVSALSILLNSMNSAERESVEFRVSPRPVTTRHDGDLEPAGSVRARVRTGNTARIATATTTLTAIY